MSPEGSAPTPRHVATPVHGRYLVQPARTAPARGWFVGYHGYAQNAEIMLDLLRPVPGADGWLVVAVQALHAFYNRSEDVVANWMTRQDRELAIADNVAYVDAVLDALAREHGEPARIVHAGFSQGVGMAYRAAALGRRPAAGVLAVAGDLPPELRTSPERPWPRVRIVTGSRDGYYGEALVRRDEALLREAGAYASARIVEGAGHEWTGDVIEEAGAFLAAVASGA